jgi:hypothetical protein
MPVSSAERSKLGLQIASLAAVEAIKGAVCAESHVIETLAQDAVFFAGAAFLFLIALDTDEFFRHHTECIVGRVSREERSAPARELNWRSKLTRVLETGLLVIWRLFRSCVFLSAARPLSSRTGVPLARRDLHMTGRFPVPLRPCYRCLDKG